ncbi:antirestriction protein ArdA [Brevibacterium aurantiacum]|uniref:antirestriction protein ArdA n=1 Tax=Brevibacterium aurantiacum TaxID=273384 RepID=UPI003F9874DF
MSLPATINATHTHAPRVWAGCLHCYNSGRLVGAWYDAADIADDPHAFDVERIHRDGGYPSTPECEELWCFDFELIPSPGEMDLLEAARWGEVYLALDAPHLWPALWAWVAAGMYTEDSRGIPCIPDFLEAYGGHWNTWEDFAYDFIDQTIDMSSWDETAQRYFNYNSFVRDLKYDYTVEESGRFSGEPGVYIFRNY